MTNNKIYAIEFARRKASMSDMRLRGSNEETVDMNFCIWAVVGPDDVVVVDTGYKMQTALKRGRDLHRTPQEGLKLIGIDPAGVKHLIVTHFHWDHLGNLDLFPNATVYAQKREMAFWTGPNATVPVFRDVIEPENVLEMVRLNFAGRLVLIDGSRRIIPGVRVHLTGGHSHGMQIIEVSTPKGTAVIASDAVKSYRNLEENAPDPFLINIPDMLKGYDLVRKLAGKESLVFPGHDTGLMDRFPVVAPGIVMLE